VLGRINAADQDSRLIISQVTHDRGCFSQSGHAFSVIWIDPFLQHVPGDGAIHRSRVDVSEAKAKRELARHAAFAGRGRSIDSDDAMRFG
jgi:hypothetical protein